MSAKSLLEAVSDHHRLIEISALLLFVAAAVVVLVSRLSRIQLAGWRLTTLLATSVAAVILCGGVIQPAGLAILWAPVSCLPDSTEWICSSAGQLAAVLVAIFGPPLLGLVALLLAWIPRREPFALRMLWGLTGLGAPGIVAWVLLGWPLFRSPPPL